MSVVNRLSLIVCCVSFFVVCSLLSLLFAGCYLRVVGFVCSVCCLVFVVSGLLFADCDALFDVIVGCCLRLGARSICSLVVVCCVLLAGRGVLLVVASCCLEL